jgi:putative transposon-encoded protein
MEQDYILKELILRICMRFNLVHSNANLTKDITIQFQKTIKEGFGLISKMVIPLHEF